MTEEVDESARFWRLSDRSERLKGENGKPYVRVVACKLLWEKRSPGRCTKFCFPGVGERERGYFCPRKPCKGRNDLAAKQKGRIRQERAPLVCWHLLHHLAGFADACWHRSKPKLIQLFPSSAVDSRWSRQRRARHAETSFKEGQAGW